MSGTFSIVMTAVCEIGGELVRVDERPGRGVDIDHGHGVLLVKVDLRAGLAFNLAGEDALGYQEDDCTSGFHSLIDFFGCIANRLPRDAPGLRRTRAVGDSVEGEG